MASRTPNSRARTAKTNDSSPYTPPAVNATANSESVSRSIVWTR